MTTNAIYQKILADMPDGLERAIMLVLSNHVGQEKRIGKDALYRLVVGSFPSLQNAKRATLDRQIRQAIESLRLQGYPVLSDSGNGGYWLGRSGEVDSFLSEIESRLNSLTAVIRALRSSKKTNWIDPPKPPTQGVFW